MEFRTILGADCYTDSNKDGIFEDIRESSIGLETLYANGIKLKVTGIIKLNEDATTTMLQGTIGYTHMLTKHIINENAKASSIAAQLNSPNKDIFTGLPFRDTDGNVSDEDKEIAFREYLVSLNENELAEAYVKIKSIPTDEYIAKVVGEVIGKLDSDGIRSYLIQTLSSMSASISEDQIKNYVKEMSDEEVKNLLTMMIAQGAAETYAAEVEKAMADIPAETLASYLNAELPTYTTEQCAKYYESVLEFSTSTYDNNLLKLGYVQLEKPASINIFASSFSDKDIIEEMITKYNENVDEVSRIEYTDYMGIMMASITTIIDAITYVLIAFVSVSLIVSSIMIGVITLISVQERTKEIGILRAIGASKRNVCSMFNAETIMLGLASGIVGVVITYLLCIPINIILYALTGISGLKATLPIGAAFWLVVISFTLTLISGFIPSRGAAKKDPVVALRTE